MPCLVNSFDWDEGILLPIGISIPGTRHATVFQGMVDTGASGTCISEFVAKAVGLFPIGLTPVLSATHITEVNIYLVDASIAFGKTSFAFPSLQVSGMFCLDQSDPVQVLIGRDILSRGNFTVSYDGHFSIAL